MKRIFRFFTIRYWKDYIRLRHILKCIKNAKRHFIKDRTEPRGVLNGMCTYLGLYLFKGRLFIYDNIKDIIPIFTPQFFNNNSCAYGYWWDVFDVQSRIDAFDKLINFYKKINKRIMNQTKYILVEWPDSQYFIGIKGCYYAQPSINDTENLDGALFVPEDIYNKIANNT